MSDCPDRAVMHVCVCVLACPDVCNARRRPKPQLRRMCTIPFLTIKADFTYHSLIPPSFPSIHICFFTTFFCSFWFTLSCLSPMSRSLGTIRIFVRCRYVYIEPIYVSTHTHTSTHFCSHDCLSIVFGKKSK